MASSKLLAKQEAVSSLTNSSPLLKSTRQRYLALDVLRGMTIALMIVVNTPGSWETIYAPFRHAAWHGFTPTDLVFPSFLFVVGNAMSFSMRKFKKQSEKAFLMKVVKRTLLIFLIGLFLNSFPFLLRENGEITLMDFSSLRIMGVLQRIALCYALAALTVRYLHLKGTIIFSVLSMLAYWVVMFYFGGQADPYSLQGNAALKFGLLIFDAENLYQGFGIPFDPEGLLSTWPATVNVLIGYLAGLYVQKKGNRLQSVIHLLLAGLLLLLLGQAWNVAFPINKPIWTSSYVLYSSGWVLLVLAGLIWLTELMQQKRWTYFFEVFGRNPLFIYVLAGAFISLLGFIQLNDTSLQSLIYQHGFLSWLEGKNASLLFAISYTLLLWLVGYWMDKNRIYIKV